MHTTPLLLCKVWKKADGGAKLPCQLRVSYGLVQNVTYFFQLVRVKNKDPCTSRF